MYETTVTVVGNVLNPPDCRRLVESQALVTHFKIATTSRRFDRANGRWVDGDSLRVRVNCWRQLAENVARSVNVGDPVIITGRLFSRDWEGEDHVKRVSYELDAFSVGHDLARGRAKFSRVKANTSTSAVDDDLVDNRIGGEPTVPATEINALPRRRSYDNELGGYVTLVEEYPGTERDPFADDVLAELEAAAGGFDHGPVALSSVGSSPSEDESTEESDEESDESDEEADEESIEESDEADAGPEPATRERRDSRRRVPLAV
jgi:single-strand DNA-binding protein